MSIKDDFKLYIDGNGLMAPAPVPPSIIRGSDNGPMFTSEYYIMLLRNSALTESDKLLYAKLIKTCIGTDNTLHRAPGDTTPDQVDDYYGTYSAHKVLNIVPTFKLPIVLCRQPQLLAAMISAKFVNLLNPLHLLIHFLAFPLFFYSALVITTSCMFNDTSDSNSRRLAWHLIQAVQHSSILCYIASLIWYRRLNKQYGILGMKQVAGIYYQPSGLNDNPYSKWWIG